MSSRLGSGISWVLAGDRDPCGPGLHRFRVADRVDRGPHGVFLADGLRGGRTHADDEAGDAKEYECAHHGLPPDASTRSPPSALGSVADTGPFPNASKNPASSPGPVMNCSGLISPRSSRTAC